MFDTASRTRRASRRAWLRETALGIGYVSCCGLASLEARTESGLGPHHAPRAQRVIFLFLHGGVSHIDSFDPKPALAQWNGRPIPIKKPEVTFAQTGNVLRSPWSFRRYGESGLPVSQLFPSIAGHIDDLCVIRSMKSNFVSHGGATLQLHTGDGNLTRPSLGAWMMYGLGSENANLPGFVNLCPSFYHGGAQNYGSAFLPARHQGMRIGASSSSQCNSTLPLNMRNRPTSLRVKFWQL